MEPHEKKIGHRDCSPWAHSELTVSSRWPKWSQPAVTEPWPGPWLSCDLAVTEPWSHWRCRDWAVTSLWLNCDLAVTSPSRDWAVIIGPGAVTTVSSRWQFFSHGTIRRGFHSGTTCIGDSNPKQSPCRGMKSLGNSNSVTKGVVSGDNESTSHCLRVCHKAGRGFLTIFAITYQNEPHGDLSIIIRTPTHSRSRLPSLRVAVKTTFCTVSAVIEHNNRHAVAGSREPKHCRKNYCIFHRNSDRCIVCLNFISICIIVVLYKNQCNWIGIYKANIHCWYLRHATIQTHLSVVKHVGWWERSPGDWVRLGLPRLIESGCEPAIGQITSTWAWQLEKSCRTRKSFWTALLRHVVISTLS